MRADITPAKTLGPVDEAIFREALAGGVEKQSASSRRSEVIDLLRAGYGLDAVSRRTGMSKSGVGKIRDRAGIATERGGSLKQRAAKDTCPVASVCV
jgi:hypothetical protein